MKQKSMNDLRREVNDRNYAEYMSLYGKRLREEQAKEFYKVQDRAYREHEKRMRRDVNTSRVPITKSFIKTSFVISMAISLVFALLLLFDGVVAIGEALGIFVGGTLALTYMIVCKP